MNKREKRKAVHKEKRENRYEDFMRGRSFKKGRAEGVRKERGKNWGSEQENIKKEEGRENEC